MTYEEKLEEAQKIARAVQHATFHAMQIIHRQTPDLGGLDGQMIVQGTIAACLDFIANSEDGAGNLETDQIRIEAIKKMIDQIAPQVFFQHRAGPIAGSA